LLHRLRHGWIGPVLVASAVSLVAVLVFVLLNAGGSDSGGPAEQGGVGGDTAVAAPRVANPDAHAGAALVDGTYRCWLRVNPADPKKLEPIGTVLVVPSAKGQYTWDGKNGTYEVVPLPGMSSETLVIFDVKFTSGPLQGVLANNVAKFGERPDIADSATLMFKDNDRRYCILAV
jgi:integrin beta 3